MTLLSYAWLLLCVSGANPPADVRLLKGPVLEQSLLFIYYLYTVPQIYGCSGRLPGRDIINASAHCFSVTRLSSSSQLRLAGMRRT